MAAGLFDIVFFVYLYIFAIRSPPVWKKRTKVGGLSRCAMLWISTAAILENEDGAFLSRKISHET